MDLEGEFMASLKVLSGHLPAVTEENHEKPLDSWLLGQDSNQVCPE
jgi:hypothetical protein